MCGVCFRPNGSVTQNSRQAAFLALRSVHRGAFADIALDRALQRLEPASPDRRLVTELVYGSVRRQRTLDALIDQLAKRRSYQQPPDLRAILHLGLYQLRYLNQIPAAAAVNTTVDLAKQNGFEKLAGFVNGLLRQYLRLAEMGDPLQLPDDPVNRLAVLYSYPDWVVQVWLEQLGLEETEMLCEWLNRSPHIDLRVNPLRASLEQVQSALQEVGIKTTTVASLPQSLRLLDNSGSIQNLPGFREGYWTVQDSSAQLVGHLLDPQPGETIVDGCAAPGGKTTHIAELMGDRGSVWGCDRYASRLKKLRQNAERLNLTCIQTCAGDSRQFTQFAQQADRVLVDVPCSGLGTLHRHADARWRQTPETVQELAQLQAELLEQAATWVKPGGVLVYSTCTLHPAENEAIAQSFLSRHSEWVIQPPSHPPGDAFVTPEGWLKVWCHQHDMDGFFIARFHKPAE